MRIYTIYKATNSLNNKSYIGFDSNWPKRKHASRKLNYKFNAAILKYGREAFEWTVLYQSNDKDHTLNEMEQYFIDLYDTINNGYNLVPGGGAPWLGKKLSPEHCAKMRASQIGRPNSKRSHPQSLETREKIRQSRLGKKWSAENRLKISLGKRKAQLLSR